MTQPSNRTPPHDLVTQLDAADPNARALALAGLVGQGAAATAALVAALPQACATTRAQIAQALAEIADPGSAEALAGLLADADPLVRGRGAQGLARLNDPRATEALARTINDLPDELHGPYTVAVFMLVQRGEAALPAATPLLGSPDALTRTRAALVVRDVLLQARGKPAWQVLTARLGDPDPQGAGAGDVDVARRWQAWLVAGGR